MIELLVVIAIISVIAGLVVPSLVAIRHGARGRMTSWALTASGIGPGEGASTPATDAAR